jgi:hypothetical protein
MKDKILFGIIGIGGISLFIAGYSKLHNKYALCNIRHRERMNKIDENNNKIINKIDEIINKIDEINKKI